MTNPQIIPDQASVTTMLLDAYKIDNADLRARVADLELERDTYQVYFKASLHALADITAKYKRHHEDQQRLQDELRDLRAMVVTECYDDALVAEIRRDESTDTTRHGTEATIQ